MTKLTNDFHNTQYETRFTIAQLAEIERRVWTGPDHAIAHMGDRIRDYKRAMAARQRIWKALCGMHDCTCGDDFGQRPRIDYMRLAAEGWEFKKGEDDV